MASLISIGQVLDHSLEHGRKHFKELLAITLWVVIASIPWVVGLLISPSDGGTPEINGGDWLSFTFSLLGTVLVTVVSIWMYATLVLAIAEQTSVRHVNLSQIYRQGWKAFFPYFFLTLFLGLIVIAIALPAVPGYVLLVLGSNENAPMILGTLGALLFLVGAVVAIFLLIKYSIQLAFAPYLLLLEKRGIADSIKGSLELVRGRWWATFLRFAAPKLIYFAAILLLSYLVFTALDVLLAFLVDTSSFLTLVVYVLRLFLSVFLSAVVTPLIIATDYYLYASLRQTR